jgi:hypothetical protein
VGDLQQAAGRLTRWLWQGYLAVGEVTLLTSLWKSGKTTLVSVLLARMKTAGSLAGLPLAAGRAVIVSEEGPSMWLERTQVVPFDNHVYWFLRPFKGKPPLDDWLALLDQILRLHARQSIDLVVIDSLANLSPLRTENDATEMVRVLSTLQRLTSCGIAVLVLHHPRKGPHAAGQAARGSGALSGFVDIIIEMQCVSRRRSTDRRRRLRAFSRHAQTPPRWIIELAADGTDYLGLGESSQPNFETGWPLLKQVLEESVGVMTRREILAAWPPGALKPAALTLWKWLDRAFKDGLLLREGAGTRKEPHRYCLPNMEAKWCENQFKQFLARHQQTRPPQQPPAPGPTS